jgi:hypothetical protein
MRQDLPHLLVPSRRGGVDGKCFIVSQMSAFQEMSVSKAPEWVILYKYIYSIQVYFLIYYTSTLYHRRGEEKKEGKSSSPILTHAFCGLHWVVHPGSSFKCRGLRPFQ